MKKFDGILLCTDLDDTLLTTNKKVSEKNYKAIEYFTENGGLFTFATGRTPFGFNTILKQIQPNTHIVCYNGGAVCDRVTKKLLWSQSLPKDYKEVLEFADKNIPYAGIVGCSATKIYASKSNEWVDEHFDIENMERTNLDYHEWPEDLMKALFMVDPEKMNETKTMLSNTDFPLKYTFVQSAPMYYELLPLNITKGTGLCKLKEMTSSRISIAVGDNENDIGSVRDADLGIAVANAVDSLKSVADYVTTADNDHDALYEIITKLDNNEFDIKTV